LSPGRFAAIFKQNSPKNAKWTISMPNFLMKGDEDELSVQSQTGKNVHAFLRPYLTDPMRTSLDDYKSLAAN